MQGSIPSRIAQETFKLIADLPTARDPERLTELYANRKATDPIETPVGSFWIAKSWSEPTVFDRSSNLSEERCDVPLVSVELMRIGPAHLAFADYLVKLSVFTLA